MSVARRTVLACAKQLGAYGAVPTTANADLARGPIEIA